MEFDEELFATGEFGQTLGSLGVATARLAVRVDGAAGEEAGDGGDVAAVVLAIEAATHGGESLLLESLLLGGGFFLALLDQGFDAGGAALEDGEYVLPGARGASLVPAGPADEGVASRAAAG